ncbi:protein kinase [bacterium]|nr:protein kinase [bacterium]
MIGQIVSHYRIVEKLGEGGMGVVYKAEDTKLKRIVALKFLMPTLTADPAAKERFIQEAQAASALEHPNICNSHEINETEDGRLYIVMAYYEGQTLKETVGSRQLAISKEQPAVSSRQLAIDKAIEIALQIAEGLREAHEKGIVHRDIKPANIMITDRGQVKILDFGLAKLAGQVRLTKTGSTVGTAAYMSPEQIRGQEMDGRADIFSLGVVLYELLTGRLPFAGEYEAAMSYAILNETPTSVRSLRPEVPPALEKIVERCLHKERDKRCQRSAELIDDLRKVQPELSAMNKIPVKSAKRWRRAGATMLALLLLGVVLFYTRTPSPSRDLKSIAVLPFKNLSDSKEDEYFSDGITDDIIAQLSKITDLKVISRTSTMRYKGMNKSIHEIGEELKVATILEGSVRHAGNQVRIVAQLIDARNEGHIWAETYDKGMTQIFTVQSDVAQQIAAALKAKLSPSEKGRIEKKQTENPEAYQLYLKGRYHWNKRRPDDIETAIAYFNQATEKDSYYAQAYTGLASAYVIMYAYGGASGVESKKWFTHAQQMAEKALAIDSTLAEAHAVLGLIAEDRYFDWAGAERHYRRAIELDPSYATHWYSSMLYVQGRFIEAHAEARRALELDPLSLIINTNLGDVYYAMREYDQALKQYKNTLALDATVPWAHTGMGSIYEIQGRIDEAIVEYEKAKNLAQDIPFTVSCLGCIYVKAGRKHDAIKVLDELLRMAQRGMNVTTSLACLYYRLGEKDRAFEWFDKAFEERDIWLRFLSYDPLWDDLRAEPRCIALLKKMGLRK